MKCLWITRLAPYPPFRGGDALYSAGLIESLALAGAEVTVLAQGCGIPPEQVPNVEWELVSGPMRRPVGSLFSRSPSLVHRFSTPQLVRRARRLVRSRRWDAIVVDNLATAGAARESWTTGSPSLVYVAHNHEASLRRALAESMARWSPRRWVLAVDVVKAGRWERHLVRRADLVTAITPEDAARFRSRDAAARVIVLSPGYSGQQLSQRIIDKEVSRRIVVLGSFRWLAKRINLERFLAATGTLERAGIGIDVVGAIDDETARALRNRHLAVNITGAVPDVAPYLQRARLGVIAEGIGGGFKLKALDYVFHRVPIAALGGSLAGLPLRAGSSVLEYPSLDSMAAGIAEAIDDFDRLNALQREAFEACSGKFDWSARGRALFDAIESARSQSSNGIRLRGTSS